MSQAIAPTDRPGTGSRRLLFVLLHGTGTLDVGAEALDDGVGPEVDPQAIEVEGVDGT